MNHPPVTDCDFLVDALLAADRCPRVILDHAGRVMRASPRAQALFRETGWAWDGATLAQWLAPIERDAWREILAEAARQGRPSRTVWHPEAGQGELAEIGVALYPVLCAARPPLVLCGMEVGAHYGRDERERELIASLLELVTRQADLPRVYECALDLVTERFPGARAIITSREDDALVLVHQRNIPSDALPLIARQPLIAGHSPCTTAVAENRPAASPNLQNDVRWPHYGQAARAYGVRADWSYPIPSEDGERAIGTLGIMQGHEALPDQTGGTLLREIAQLIGLATHRHERFTDLQHRAFHDPLTGLANRQLLEDRLEQSLAVSRRSGQSLALLMLDLDNFKQINDSLGHAAGDELLVEVAGRLRERRRPSDTVARLGGDEFVILLPATDRHGAEAVARSVLDSLHHPIQLEGSARDITPSIGVALSDAATTRAGELLRAADRAMYRVKVNGKDGYAFEDRVARPVGTAPASQAVELSADEIRRGVTMVATARCDEEDRVAGIRAAIRWSHPVHGDMPFARLLRLLEARGRRTLAETAGAAALVRVGLGEAVEKLDARMIYAPGTTSLWDAHFIERLAGYVTTNRLAPRGFELDLSAALPEAESTERLVELCAVIRRTLGGVRVSVAGLGGADAPLATLARMAVDTLLLAPEVLDLPDETLRATVALARTLAPELVAGGLTEAWQVQRARAAGVRLTEGPVHAARLPGTLPAADRVTAVQT